MTNPEKWYRVARQLARQLVGAGLSAFIATAASAHEFTAAILVQGPGAEARLVQAVNGFLLAADERDGHPDETSDGHLGGVDVQVLPLPRAAAVRVRNLAGTPQEPPDVVVIIGPNAVGSVAQDIAPNAIWFVQPKLPDGSNWADDDQPASFAARYTRLYQVAPTEAAAQGYFAARRLDAAIRPLDGLEPRLAIETSLAESADIADW